MDPRCGICQKRRSEHGRGRGGVAYAAPFGWHEHTSVRGWSWTPPPEGYRPRRVDLSVPAPGVEATEAPPVARIRVPERQIATESLGLSPAGKTEPEQQRVLVPRPKRTWGSWRKRFLAGWAQGRRR